MAESLQDEVQIREQESIKDEALKREDEAREQDNMGVLGNAGQAARAAEDYARAEAAEKALKDHEAVAEMAAEVEYRIDNAADHA